MQYITFTVPGAPFGKQRPRHNRKTGVTYTPADTKRRENQIAAVYKSTFGNHMFGEQDYIEMQVYAYYPIPTSTTKKKKVCMVNGDIRPTVKPDWDNVGKLIADALNGVAYKDDKQIVSATVKKFYSQKPRTQVFLGCVRKEERGDTYDERFALDGKGEETVEMD